MAIKKYVQFTGDNLHVLAAFMPKSKLSYYGELAGRLVIEITTENGRSAVSLGDFLVQYDDGHFDCIREFEFEKLSVDIEFDFGTAINLLKAGKKVARKGWNGKGMWLILVPGTPNIVPKEGTPYSLAGLTEEIQILPHIDMYTTDSTGRRAMLPGWLASQSDMLSTDWVIVK